MIFKSEKLKEEFYSVPAMLQVMATHFEQLCVAYYKKEPVITRVREKVEGSSGVHEAGRGIDFRYEHGDEIFVSEHDAQFLVSEMNRKFTRTDSRKTMMLHSFNGGPKHFHLQLQAGHENDEVDCSVLI